MHLRSEALVVAVRQHGEHGAIVRALTRDDGIRPGYVRGGRSRAMRPILLPANVIQGEWRSRTEDQLAGLTVELVHSRAAVHGEPLAAAGLDWATALTATALPEAQPYPKIHAGLTGLLDAIEAAPSAKGWVRALVLYELLLLGQLGFGLDLQSCTVTGIAEDLAFVSPRSGAAVGRAAARGYEAKLLPLPAFLLDGGAPDWPAIFDGLRLTGHFLARDILTDRRADPLAARDRLVDRLKRAVA